VPPKGHALVNRATIANLSSFAHHHAHGMVKKHPLTDLGTRVNFDPSQAARDV
jgi:hypothetical protein